MVLNNSGYKNITKDPTQEGVIIIIIIKGIMYFQIQKNYF